MNLSYLSDLRTFFSDTERRRAACLRQLSFLLPLRLYSRRAEIYCVFGRLCCLWRCLQLCYDTITRNGCSSRSFKNRRPIALDHSPVWHPPAIKSGTKLLCRAWFVLN